MSTDAGNITYPVDETDEVWLHECQPCGLSFDYEHELISHIKSGHANVEENRILRQDESNDRKKSTNEAKKQQNTIKCNICQRIFTNRSTLSEHRWAHSKDLSLIHI